MTPNAQNRYDNRKSAIYKPNVEFKQSDEVLSADIRAQINRLKEFLTFEDAADEQLAEMPFAPELVPLLKETLAQLKEFFPSDTEYSLCKSPDPFDSGFVLDIWAHGDTKIIQTTLRRFRKAWWLDHMPESADILTIGVHRI